MSPPLYYYFHSWYQLSVFSIYELLCYIWKELGYCGVGLVPAFLLLRARIENDSNSNSNQVLLNIYQVNSLLSLLDTTNIHHQDLPPWINLSVEFNNHSQHKLSISYSVSNVILHPVYLFPILHLRADLDLVSSHNVICFL